MSILTGRLREQIKFERATVTKSAMGTEVEGPWATIADAWAAVSYGTAAERREAAAAAASQAATFTVRANATVRGVGPRDRIFFEGAPWSITGSALSPDRSTIAFTATRRTG